MKTAAGTIEPVPSKRVFASIIADYNLNRALCELIDNAIDQWVRSGKKKPLNVNLVFDKDQQTIRVEDNAGGVKREELEILIGPGLTSNRAEDETIGIFGVGTKRAVVALGEDIIIRSRHSSKLTYQIEIDDDWLKDESWKMQVFQVDEIPPSSTQIILAQLRLKVDEPALARLCSHLSITYAFFLKPGQVTINVDGVAVPPSVFDNWAYPPGYGPRRFVFDLKTADGKTVHVQATSGLSRESSPAGGEYGVYVYCNSRLIAPAIKDHHVGFGKGMAGAAHPKVSLVRIIVELKGEAGTMPWNSTKSGINYSHQVFSALRDWLVEVVKEYASLSRGWTGDWPKRVFRHKVGTIEEIKLKDVPTAKKTYLPPLPKFKPRFADKVQHANEKIYKAKPWSRGLAEGMIAVDTIGKANLDQKNRIALILLDSTVEIAFKEYLVHDSGSHYTDQQLGSMFKQRHLVHQEVQKYVQFVPDFWKKIGYYNGLRNKLIHERATVQIADHDIKEFRGLVDQALTALFKLKVS